MKKFRYWLEYVLLRSVGGAIRLLPVRPALALGRAMGSVFYISSKRREIALDNLRLAYGDELEPREVERIARGMFRHFGQSIIESIWMRGRVTPEWLAQMVSFENAEALHEALAKGRGAILVTAHFGNWELVGHAISKEFGSAWSIASPLRNPYIDRYLNGFREETGQRIIKREGALKAMLRVLRDGELMLMLVDQHAHSGGIEVKFFGRNAWTLTAPAAIAVRTGCPVVIAYCCSDKLALHHRVVVQEVVEFESTGDRKGDVRRATEYITQGIETFIRKHPEQWLWLHRRWKPGPLEHPKGARVERHSQ